MLRYHNLFTPIKIGKLEIKNRFALAPMGPLGLADAEGGFNQKGIDYYTERKLEYEVPEIHLLGDARRVSNIMHGIWDVFEVASHIE